VLGVAQTWPPGKTITQAKRRCSAAKSRL